MGPKMVKIMFLPAYGMMWHDVELSFAGGKV